ncbi:hypothetical protein [Paenibacillus harenae]|uniref:hypothetical protein n=1 Tax=Paenibacillus harenae TaxID=306543 RepID=UPI00040F4054|nr:hypothetical protein [Paenibacillus harenae]
MAFGIKRAEMELWKQAVARGDIAYLTHYWIDPRFPGMRTVTKVGCADLDKLSRWCVDNGLNPRYIHARSEYPHFDLLGSKQRDVLLQANQMEQLRRFGMLS